MQHLNKILTDYKKLHLLYNAGAVFTAFDTETTGVSPSDSRIIEIGAVTFNKDGIISSWEHLFNPGFPIPPFITQLTHITDSMVMECPDIKVLLPEFKNYISDNILIAHNAQFDLNFINSELERADITPARNKTIDTLRYSKWVYPNLPRYKLDFLADYLQINKGTSHRAMDDALTCMNLFIKICDRFNNRL
ncbi:MAG: 3'-5' exonuclease [Treponema sp.]|nr:3'-5' exonuclease [Treponema sp.]